MTDGTSPTVAGIEGDAGAGRLWASRRTVRAIGASVAPRRRESGQSEGLGESLSRRGSVFRVDAHRVFERSCDRRGSVWHEVLKREHAAFEGRGDRGGGLIRVGRLARERGVSENAEREHVRPMIHCVGCSQLLRRHEAGRSEHFSGCSQSCELDRLCDAEVDQFHRKGPADAGGTGEKHVRRLEVAMDETGPVDRLEHAGDAVDDRYELMCRDRATLHHREKRLALEQLHDQKDEAIGTETAVENADHARMFDAVKQLGFPPETFDRLLFVRQTLVEDFDGDALPGPRIHCGVYRSHPSGGQEPGGPVALSKDKTGGWRQRLIHPVANVAGSPGPRH